MQRAVLLPEKEYPGRTRPLQSLAPLSHTLYSTHPFNTVTIRGSSQEIRYILSAANADFDR